VQHSGAQLDVKQKVVGSNGRAEESEAEVLKGTRNCIGVISEGLDNGRGNV